MQNRKREEKTLNKLPNDYQNFIALSRYARWLPDKKRRETWEETVGRYFDFMKEHLMQNTQYLLTAKTRSELDAQTPVQHAQETLNLLMGNV